MVMDKTKKKTFNPLRSAHRGPMCKSRMTWLRKKRAVLNKLKANIKVYEDKLHFITTRNVTTVNNAKSSLTGRILFLM